MIPCPFTPVPHIYTKKTFSYRTAIQYNSGNLTLIYINTFALYRIQILPVAQVTYFRAVLFSWFRIQSRVSYCIELWYLCSLLVWNIQPGSLMTLTLFPTFYRLFPILPRGQSLSLHFFQEPYINNVSSVSH